MRPADFILGIVGVGLQGWIAGILVRKKLHRRFPAFTVYTVYSIAITIVRLVLLKESPRIFNVIFWASEAPYALLGIAALYEAFTAIFRPLYGAWWFRLLLYAIVLVPLAVTIQGLLKAPPVETGRMGVVILALEIGVRYVQGMAFALSFALIKIFHIPAKRYPVGIVDGFGATAVGMLAATLFRSEFGMKFNTFYRFAPAVAYILALLIWLTSLYGPEDRMGTEGQPPLSPEEMHDRLRRSTEEAKKISRHKWK